MLGLRAAARSDNGVSAAELTFGRNLRLPAEFYDTVANSNSNTDGYDLVEKIRSTIKSFKPATKSHSGKKTFFVHPDLPTCEYVFVRDDAVRRPLQPPYSGPYRVIKRQSKVYIVQFPGRQVAISVDRLKPAHMLSEPDDGNAGLPAPADAAREAPASVRLPPVLPPPHQSATSDVVRTRSGRVTKPPARFA